MNQDLFLKLYNHFNETLKGGDFGTTEYIDVNSTRADFGTDDDICLNSGKYFYAYSDEADGLPMPMFCLPLQKEMYEDFIVDCHQVLIWKLASIELPFDSLSIPEGTIELPCEEVCPGEPELHHC